jgi:Ca2+-binding EF-hand superfamily protein
MVAAGGFVASAALDAQGRVNMRFQAMDKNGDGTIARAEWRGSAKSFEVHDWNRDGKLSGDEVRVGASRRDQEAEPNFDSSDREYVFHDWTAQGFRTVDHNKDGRITRDEWHFDRQGFRYADHNNDGTITRAEFLNETAEDDDREDRFSDLDDNRDGRVSKDEWHGGAARFAALDANRDGLLTPDEILGTAPPADLFSSVDINRDRIVSRDEWHWSRASFDQRDLNKDGRLSAQEFDGSAAPIARTPAYRGGYERGTADGRVAGREDRIGTGRWDLEGQSELEAADAGYKAEFGARANYQVGYRDGFRRGYREGWERGN